MNSAKRFFYEILYDGTVWCEEVYHPNWLTEEQRITVTRGKDFFWPRRIVKDTLYEILYLDFCNYLQYGEVNMIAFGKAAKRFAGFEGNNIKLTINGKRKPGYELPPLDQARMIFSTSEPGLADIQWPLPNCVDLDSDAHKSFQTGVISHILDDSYNELKEFENELKNLSDYESKLKEFLAH